MTGVYQGQWGSAGAGDGQFEVCGDPIPGVDISLEQVPGGIAALDPGNDRVQMFDLAGNYLRKFGSFGSADGQFDNPAGIIIDDENAAIYVSDTGNSRIQKFDWNGDFQYALGAFGSGNGQFDNPAGIIVDDKNAALYVLDAGNNRIQKFGPTTISVIDGPPGNSLFLSAAPNPSSGRTTISFTLDQSGPAVITLYNVSGRQLRQWDVSSLPAGEHHLAWDGLTEDGVSVPSSVVFCRLRAGAQTLSSQLIRLQ